jgi:hypothetical protein
MDMNFSKLVYLGIIRTSSQNSRLDIEAIENDYINRFGPIIGIDPLVEFLNTIRELHEISEDDTDLDGDDIIPN